MKSMIITLGHNSSAILVEDGKILFGIEEERLSGIKSDSMFPIRSIEKLRSLYPIPENSPICVSHWFLDGQLPGKNKYWDPDYLRDKFPRTEILGLDKRDFTHHDAHRLSAEVFAGPEFPKDHHTFVVDGFGTEGECYSVYHGPILVHRFHGYDASIGLFYQYATAFCDMKMHQHEYKMLAYEVQIHTVIGQQARERIDELVDRYSEDWYHVMSRKESSLTDLVKTQSKVGEDLQRLIGKIDDVYKRRIVASYATQRHTENVIRNLFNQFQPENLLVVGGVFFNVKINSMLADLTPGKFCVMPLAGDQGAGLGVYERNFHNLQWSGHLFWGQRTLKEFKQPGIEVLDTELELQESIAYHLQGEGGIVNVVRGAMEFGPRALCNTTTLAIPSLQNAALINKMNDRTNEMPFALVITRDQLKDYFEDTEKVHQSLEYMIVTRRFEFGAYEGLEGGAHYYPIEDHFTCRPQVTDDPMMVTLLEEFGPLINTSFNYHGQPIVYDAPSIDWAHMMERKRYPITTLVLKGE